MASMTALTRQLRASLGMREIGVSVRLDPWFVEYNPYPLVPTYLLAPYLGCGAAAGHELRCSGQGFRP